MSASLDGETISNNEAKQILRRLVGYRIWYDLTVNRFMSTGGSLTDDETETILDNIKSQIKGAKE